MLNDGIIFAHCVSSPNLINRLLLKHLTDKFGVLCPHTRVHILIKKKIKKENKKTARFCTTRLFVDSGNEGKNYREQVFLQTVMYKQLLRNDSIYTYT